MRTVTMHRSPLARTTNTTRYRALQPRRTSRWWPREREQALQSTRMLSLAMLLGLTSWSLILGILLVWFTR